MIPFEVLFRRSTSESIVYNGKTLIRRYSFENINRLCLHFKFISTDSEYRQSINLLLLDGFIGKVYVNDQQVRIPKAQFPKIVFWEDTAPSSFTVTIVAEKGKVSVCNGSAPCAGEDFCYTLVQGCAMIPEILDDSKVRFYCNDHVNDDDFTDMVFEMQAQLH